MSLSFMNFLFQCVRVARAGLSFISFCPPSLPSFLLLSSASACSALVILTSMVDAMGGEGGALKKTKNLVNLV